jgi:hypothetical protein
MLRQIRLRPTIAVGAILATCLGTGVVTATGAHAGPPQDIGAAYVWADEPTSASYTPAVSYQWNSTSPTRVINHVQRTGVGVYLVFMKNLVGNRGTVSVTAYGESSAYCKVVDWFPVPDGASTSQRIRVHCFDRTGTPVDSRFTVSYANRQNTPFPMAYLWADQPFATRYVPNPLYRFSSAGQVTTIQRDGPGLYLVSLPGFRRPGASDITGIAMVTAYGPGPARCGVDFGPGGFAAIEGVAVSCTTPSGQLVDSQFTLTYVEDGNVLGGRRGTRFHESAYARGMRDHTGVMSSPAEFAFPSDGTVRVATLSTGTYRVTLPVDLRAGHVQVVAAFASFRQGKHCKVAGWSPGSGATVLCFARDGTPTDVDFHLTFVGPSLF